MAATEEVWLPREVHNNDRGTTYRNDVAIVQGHKWGQARLCTGPQRSFPPSYQQCLTMLSETWGMASA